jgi:hypothetical protein
MLEHSVTPPLRGALVENPGCESGVIRFSAKTKIGILHDGIYIKVGYNECVPVLGWDPRTAFTSNLVDAPLK